MFQAVGGGALGLHAKSASGTGADEPLLTQPTGIVIPTHWSHDGRFILYERNAAMGTAVDIWALPLFGDRQPFAVVATGFTHRTGSLSADGRWVAYQSNETGVGEVYVQPFPPTGGKYQISTGGGALPTWRADGKELFFISVADRSLRVVRVESAAHDFQTGTAKRLFPANLGANIAGVLNQRQYAVSKDGQRFLVNMTSAEMATEPITVTVNWVAALQK